MASETKDEGGISPLSSHGDTNTGVVVDEKPNLYTQDTEASSLEDQIERELNVTEDDLLEAKAVAGTMSTDQVIALMKNVLKIHERDPNFPHAVLIRIDEFLANEDVLANPEKHAMLIYEMKLEAALITNNSPYSEVRSVVSNTDDPSMPCSTIRAWAIGILFSVLMSFVNQLFSARQPPIFIESNVAQLLAYPIGKAWEKAMPNWSFALFGTTHYLNPGPFNKKEHMLIAIMANTAKSLPYSQYIVWSQALPMYFNQQYARSFGYQILIALSTNFIGYGLAGLTRRFIVYPAYCLWPASLVTIALNAALHDENNLSVAGPFKRMFKMSRYKFFLWCFGAMFIYFWFPNYLFTALTYFSWITWIAPNNVNNSIINGMQHGLGMFNPWPTFDWNVMLYDQLDPLMVPWFSTINRTIGMWLFGFVIMGIYYTNSWNTGYLPINSNRVYDHFGLPYNVSMTIDDKGLFDEEKYMSYSAPYIGSAAAIVYAAFFGLYTATIVHVALFHRFEISTGFKNVWAMITRKKKASDANDGEYMDVHNRLMKKYPEVSEWWYLGTLLIAAALGFAGVGAYPTYTTLGVVPYGVILAVIFVIPVGIVKSMTGVEVSLNVLAEFIGGFWAQGNALAMNFFKCFGYVTCAHAVHFANDLKVAHYLKINPRHTFSCQMIATLISTFVSVGVLSFQINIPKVCEVDAPMRFTCPGQNTFFTSSVLWGTIGPQKVFSHQGQYAALLLGFPVGAVTALMFWGLVKWFPRNSYIRQFHPVAMWYGGVWWAPYSFSYAWPAVPIAWLSWIYVKNRWLGLWSKYNFVLSAAFSASIAISGLVMLFSVQWADVQVNWWGNIQPYKGCEGVACTLKTLAEGERFYAWWNPDQVLSPQHRG